MNDLVEWLECQTCGGIIRRLTEKEKLDIAVNPYNYVVDCNSCKKDKGL